MNVWNLSFKKEHKDKDLQRCRHTIIKMSKDLQQAQNDKKWIQTDNNAIWTMKKMWKWPQRDYK